MNSCLAGLCVQCPARREVGASGAKGCPVMQLAPVCLSVLVAPFLWGGHVGFVAGTRVFSMFDSLLPFPSPALLSRCVLHGFLHASLISVRRVTRGRLSARKGALSSPAVRPAGPLSPTRLLSLWEAKLCAARMRAGRAAARAWASKAPAAHPVLGQSDLCSSVSTLAHQCPAGPWYWNMLPPR